MSKLLLYILFFPLLFSCHTSYYYAQLESADPYMEKNEQGNFVFDSDSILISYSFAGENAPVKVSVVNKMRRPVYVDWGNSFFSFGDSTDNRISMAAYMGNEYKKISTIQPGFSKTKEIFELSGLYFDKLEKKLFRKEEVGIFSGKRRSLNVARFTEENTPLLMKSSLSLHPGSAIAEPIVYNQYFYIGQVINGGSLSPQNFADTTDRRGDLFFTRKERGKGLRSVLRVGGEVLLVAGLVAVEVILTSEDD